MKRIVNVALLIAFVCPTLGLTQDTSTTTPTRPSDKQAQKQVERERKQDKVEEKEEAERRQDQLGVRCSRLKGKRKQ